MRDKSHRRNASEGAGREAPKPCRCILCRAQTTKRPEFRPLPGVAELAMTRVERLIQSVSVTCFLSTDVGINKRPLGRYERLMNRLP